MGCPQAMQSIEVIIEEIEGGVALKSVNNSEKSAHNGNKTAELDLDKLFVNSTRAAIDPSAIVSLNLSGSNLNYFPDGFAGLELKLLDLSHNKLQNVPNCILNGLRSLETLNLSHNPLQCFDEPKCVKKLRILQIDNTRLPNIPEWILKVHAFNLEELSYSFNELTTLKASQFLKTASYELAKLEMKNCVVRSQDLKYLKHIRTLTVLNLSNENNKNRNCFASSDSFSTLFDKPTWDDRLKVLVLNDLQISFLPDEVVQLTALEELYVVKNDLLWLPDSITMMGKLRILDLSHNQLAGVPENMSNLKKLEVFKAPHNSISQVRDLFSMHLKILDLYDNYLDSDCDIKLDHTILQVDLEKNFFNTASLESQGYEEKKRILRLNVGNVRNDGTKEDQYDDKSSTSTVDDSSDCESPSEFVEDKTGKNEKVEANWSFDRGDETWDSGVTSSDNEWTGRESAPVIRNKRKPKLPSYPSWMFEDVDS